MLCLSICPSRSWSFSNFWQIFLSDSMLVILFLLRGFYTFSIFLSCYYLIDFNLKIDLSLYYFEIFYNQNYLGCRQKGTLPGHCFGRVFISQELTHTNLFWESTCVPCVRSDGLCNVSIHSCNLHWYSPRENTSAHFLTSVLKNKDDSFWISWSLWVVLQLISEMNTALKLNEDLSGINTPGKGETN